MFSTFNILAQDGGCETEAPANPPEVQGYTISPKTIQFYFHIVRDDFGQGGHTDQQVDEQINLLFGDLADWSITGIEVGRDIIKDSYYLNYNGNYNEFFEINPHNNAIDVYFTGTNKSSKANNIPGNACLITFNGIGNRLISHEVGHCLGLLHTHHYTNVDCRDFTGTYPECKQCGDKVCDTPPDPKL